MAKNTDKLYDTSQNVFSVLLPVFYVFGVIAGSVFVFLSDASDWSAEDTWRLSGLFRAPESGFLPVFSGYLFDFIFVFLIEALFGITFLGVAAVPITVLYKGAMQGIVLSVYLAQNPDLLYLQKWIAYIPTAALGTMVFLFYSVRTGSISLHLFRALIKQEHAELPIKLYLAQTVVMLFIFTAIAVIQCVSELLVSILF